MILIVLMSPNFTILPLSDYTVFLIIIIQSLRVHLVRKHVAPHKNYALQAFLYFPLYCFTLSFLTHSCNTNRQPLSYNFHQP